MKNYFIDNPERESNLTYFQTGFIKGIYRSVYEMEKSIDTSTILSVKVKNILDTLVKKGGDKGMPKKKVTESLAIRAMKAIIKESLKSIQESYMDTICEIFGWTPEEFSENTSKNAETDNLFLYDKMNDAQRGIAAGHCMMIYRFSGLVNMGDKVKEHLEPLYNIIFNDLTELFKDCPAYLSANTFDKYVEWTDDIIDCFNYVGVGLGQNIYTDTICNVCDISFDALNEYYNQDKNIENWNEHNKDGLPLKTPELQIMLSEKSYYKYKAELEELLNT